MSTSPIPRSIKLFYGVGQYGEGVMIGAYYVFLLFYYNQVLELAGSLAVLMLAEAARHAGRMPR